MDKFTIEHWIAELSANLEDINVELKTLEYPIADWEYYKRSQLEQDEKEIVFKLFILKTLKKLQDNMK